MSVEILPLNLLTAFVIAVNNFVETPLIMSVQVLVDDDSRAFLVWAINSAVLTNQLMGVHFLSLQSDLTAFFKEALTSVRAIYHLQRAVLAYMTIHFTLFDTQTAFIFARYNSFWALILYMLFHSIQLQSDSAFQ